MNSKNRALIERLNPETVPKHVGLILDGNGRWAQERGMPRMMGHRAGMEQLRSAVRFAHDAGIEILSVYAFSSENWKRPEEEIKGLMRLLLEYMKKELEELNREGVLIRFMGETDQLPRQVYEALEIAKQQTAQNKGLIFNIGLNYGSQHEIVRACQILAQKAATGEMMPEDISNEIFEEQLYTGGLAALDLLIRTSGEERISNFMLYQLAYAELIFAKRYWPDFDEEAFCDALLEYEKRNRRFGGI